MKKVKLDDLPVIADQSYGDGDQRWVITQLIEEAKDLPIFEIPLIHFTIPEFPWEIDSYRDLIGHIQRIEQADLKYPIILDDCGQIMDGFHRFAKALMLKKATIKAVRFDETPRCTFIKVED